MLPDDVYRSKLHTAIEGLRYWIPSVSDVARTVEEESGDFWRLSVVPHTGGACPFELLLEHGQRYGLVIDGSAFEGLPAGTLAGMTDLVDAIAAGRVVRSTWVRAKTAQRVATRLTIDMGRGRIWSEALGNEPEDGSDDFLRTNRHYLPYRR